MRYAFKVQFRVKTPYGELLGQFSEGLPGVGMAYFRFSRSRVGRPDGHRRLFGRLSIPIAFTTILNLFGSEPATADLRLQKDERWIVLASSRELDEAIGIAAGYEWRFERVSVIESSNGWLAAVAGPVKTTNSKETKAKLLAEGDVPPDLFLSNGVGLVRTVWEPRNLDVRTVKYERGPKLQLPVAQATVSITDRAAPNSPSSYVPVLTIIEEGVPRLETALDESETRSANARLQIATLDPSAAAPQLVFSSYWLGAHCCTVVKILTRTPAGWEAIEGGTLDGDVGYDFEDFDSDGRLELVSIDQAFLYAFGPYVSSWAPIKLQQLQGNRLADLRSDPRFLRRYRQELFRLQHQAVLRPELWRSNGYLAAWVALKAVLGEHDEAWQKMLASYDTSNDWPLTICDSDLVNGLCPKGSERNVPFPVALRSHLERNGYMREISPKRSEPAVSAATPPPASAPEQSPAAGEFKSFGTGFFVTSGGHVVTNHHVVQGCNEILVRRSAEFSASATIVASDKNNDLALLKIDREVQSFAPIQPAIRLGENIAAFGYPLSQVLSSNGNFTLGNVTALTGLRDDSRFLQISAPVQPGNSGGPLLDNYGNVVGVVTSKLNALAAIAATGDVPQNINFALRSVTLLAFLSSHSIEAGLPLSGQILSPPDLAEKATSFSVAVLCR